MNVCVHLHTKFYLDAYRPKILAESNLMEFSIPTGQGL